MAEDQMVTDDEGFGRLAGSSYVTSSTYAYEVPVRLRRAMTASLLAQALAAAADDDGRIEDFDIIAVYEKHVSDALRNEDDEPDWGLRWDRFSSVALMDTQMWLIMNGYLASRGNGDSISVRLCMPAVP